MENMDSTVISTSLPAIARALGTNPLALKLAVTSYLLALAIFIPASGWTADRFGARHVFRARHRRVRPRLDRLRAVAVRSTEFVLARIVQGMGGAMMTPVGRLILVRSIDKTRARQRHGARHHPGADRPDLRAAARRLHHHLRIVALDLHHQRADRPRSASIWRRATSRMSAPSSAGRFDFVGFVLSGLGIGGLAFGLSVMGLAFLPGWRGRGAARRRRRVERRLCRSCAAHAGADPRSQPVQVCRPSAPAFSAASCSGSASAPCRSCCRCCCRSAST